MYQLDVAAMVWAYAVLVAAGSNKSLKADGLRWHCLSSFVKKTSWEPWLVRDVQSTTKWHAALAHSARILLSIMSLYLDVVVRSVGVRRRAGCRVSEISRRRKTLISRSVRLNTSNIKRINHLHNSECLAYHHVHHHYHQHHSRFIYFLISF